jgi:hypothetical protein
MSRLRESIELLGPDFGPEADFGVFESMADAGFEAPAALHELYEMGDGIMFGAYPSKVLSVKDAVRYNHFAPLEYSVYHPWPFFEAVGSGSDPICVIVKGPATGYVMQRNHDADDRMLAPSIEAFFDWIATQTPEVGFFGDEGPSPLFTGLLSEAQRAMVEEMMALAPTAEDSYEGESMYDLVSSMVDDATYFELFSREVAPIRNYRACVLMRARRMSPELATPLQEMYKL